MNDKIKAAKNIDLNVMIKDKNVKTGEFIVEAKLTQFAIHDKDGQKIATTEKVVNGLAKGDDFDAVQKKAIDNAVELMGL